MLKLGSDRNVIGLLITFLILGVWIFGCTVTNGEESDISMPINAATLIAERGDTTWDLVALGDSTPTGYGVGAENSYINLYASYISEDLEVEVVVHNWATNSTRTVLDWVEVIRTNEGVREDLRNAEVVTIWLGWHDLIPSIGAIGKGGPCYKRGEIDLDCFRDVTDPMEQGFDDLLSEITSLTSPNETLILIADTGNPFVDTWIKYGTLDALKGPAFEEWRTYLMEAAGKHGVHVVNTYNAINGPNGDQSLPSEYSQADGLHFNELGHKLLADIHREVGYEYSKP
jgi:lysophospholipase L1-like esterase